MAERRIWVTGVGIVSPLGRTATITMDRLVAGERAIGPLTLFDVGTKVDIACEVAGLTADQAHGGGAEDGWSRTDAMAFEAAREALSGAGLDPASEPVDLILGGTTAGMFETEDLLAQLAKDPGAMRPLRRMLSHPLSSTGDHLWSEVAPFRSVRNVCSACSSGANAILIGAQAILQGRARAVLAGGADGLCRLTFTGFGALAALDPNPCRPFDRRRAGLNLGEGAAFLVLEPAELALRRGAVPIVELCGWAVGAEAHHITNPEREGTTAARVMRQALARAGMTPSDLDYVNAHGTATPLNDSMETAALRACLGHEVERIPVSSSKGQIGHTLGAAGAIEAAICALAVSRGVIPPTVGLSEVDEACRLRHVFRSEEAPLRAAMSNSFGFGGTDTALVLGKPGLFPPPESTSARRVVVSAAATVGPLGIHTDAACASYLEDGPPPTSGPIDFNAADHLDLDKARRLDRAGRLAAVVIQRALDAAGVLDASRPADHIGAIVGGSFGSVDASTAYMRRIYDRGAKFASPADFPNLVPSSPVGHAAIYLKLRGPVFALADLGATAETGIVTAIELVAGREADVMVAGSVEEFSPTIELVLGPLCSGIARTEVRSEGSAVLVLEAEEHAATRGHVPLARVVFWAAWHGEDDLGARELARLPPPPAAGACAVIAEDPAHARALLRDTRWRDCPVQGVSRRTGSHEGAGGFAAAAAASLVGRGALRRALLLSRAPGRGYAVVLSALDGADEPDDDAVVG